MLISADTPSLKRCNFIYVTDNFYLVPENVPYFLEFLIQIHFLSFLQKQVIGRVPLQEFRTLAFHFQTKVIKRLQNRFWG